MKDVRKLFMVSRKFYLGIVLLWFAIFLVDSIYICNDKGIILTEKEMSTYVEQSMEKENGIVSLETQSVELWSAIQDKGSYSSLVAIGFTLFVIIVGLLLKEMAYSDERTREFRRTWPVKNSTRELYDYFMFLGIIVIGFLLQTVGLLFAQTRHNGLLVKVLNDYGIVSKVEDVMHLQTSNLIVAMGCYVLWILSFYTWVYFSMSITKNVVLGMVLSLVIRGAVCAIINVFACDMTGMFYITEFFWNFNPDSNTVLYNTSDYFSVTSGDWMLAQILLTFFLILCIILSARRKEMTKGTVFYFPLLDYPFAFLMGLGAFAFSAEEIFYEHIGFELSIITGVIVLVVSFLLVHPFSLRKTKRLEVK